MFLGFDIGNTRTTIGIYSQDKIIPLKLFHYKTQKEISSENLKRKILKEIDPANYSSAFFSCVVPSLKETYLNLFRQEFKKDLFEISSSSKLKIKINYDNPKELGIDRIVNAEAVFNEYQDEAIIVDLGTAITFCVLLAGGSFEGGLIVPGVKTMMDSLRGKAAHLPTCTYEKPEVFIAKDSFNAVKAGFFYGSLALIEGLILKIEAYYQKKFKIILTGGFSKTVGDNLSLPNKVDPLLTMKGLKYIYDLNHKKG